jgi:hypothetical protein
MVRHWQLVGMKRSSIRRHRLLLLLRPGLELAGPGLRLDRGARRRLVGFAREVGKDWMMLLGWRRQAMQMGRWVAESRFELAATRP